MDALPIRGFSHVSLSVTDLEASFAFYRDVLGLPVLAEPYAGEVFAGREAMLRSGRAALCLQAHDNFDGSRFDHLGPASTTSPSPSPPSTNGTGSPNA